MTRQALREDPLLSQTVINAFAVKKHRLALTGEITMWHLINITMIPSAFVFHSVGTICQQRVDVQEHYCRKLSTNANLLLPQYIINGWNVIQVALWNE